MSVLEHRPAFGDQEVLALAQELYGLRATATPLPSERDQNVSLETEAGERFVLKIANALEDRGLLEAQTLAMLHLARHEVPGPRVVPTSTASPSSPSSATDCRSVGDGRGGGASIAEIRTPSGETHLVRLVTYVEGIPLGEQGWHSDELLRSLGAHLGQIDAALTQFDHPATHRDFYWDLANASRIVRKFVKMIADANQRALIQGFADAFERDVEPLLPQLPTSVIHNDANDYNVIVGGGEDLYTRNQRISGIIDFGDIVHSYTVCDLAIAVAYAMLDKPDPLAAAALLVHGYHEQRPLSEPEVAALWGFACMRLCASACIAAAQARQRPDDPYLTISQRPIQDTLPRLAQISPRFAEATFRHACGLPPVSQAERIVDWLRANAESFAPVLDVDLRTMPCAVFDLSIGSPLVSGDPAANAEPALTERLYAQMEAAGVQVGVGRHDEARLLYTAPLFKTGDAWTDERRTVHLGLDLFAQPGTPVHAPLEGTVYAATRREAPMDYGTVVVLEHRPGDGPTFYTLYGHLAPSALDGLHIGQSVAHGQQFGMVGAPDVNGGWTPHLHLQIIGGLLDLDAGFPGVCRASQRAVWTALSPDPNLLLGIPGQCFPERAPTKADTLAARQQRIGRNLSIGYRNHCKIERGWMQYLYDNTGRRYLDAYNNVPHVGHCHPRVVRAGQEQMAILNTNTRYLNDLLTRYAERLAATLPDPLQVCFFVNSGSEANELALRLARAYTGQRDTIVLEAAYHGNTTSLIDISPYKHDGPGGTGAPPWVHTVPIADIYRGAYKAGDPEAGRKYALPVQEAAEGLRAKGRGLAAYIAESCPSVGGQILFPPGYLAHVYRHVRQAGGVCIADEVQTGYGRIGTHFYAFEAQGVVPDIVVLGKPIGNGHPIGAVVTTPEIATAFDNGMEFFSTFGGSTVSCAIGLSVLETVLEGNLQAHALRVGERMLAGMRSFVDRYPIVGDVRGSGLFLGVELVRDRETLEPAGEEASFVANRMRKYGILLGTDGPYHNVVKIRPPMPFDEQNADLLVATMGRILSESFS
jgi:4-aminobutyrate aminotransferase-like enzyme/Ser/Thr protein kinase RdoA (MazF antagonist)